jgi:Tfp pilus assembly protein PilX
MVRNERGQALMAVIAGISLVLVTLTAGIVIVQFSGKLTQRQLTEQGQALNAAQAGLTEGLSWFRRQAAQPVTNFTPVLNTTVAPPILDTQDQTIGLVREYPVSDPGRVWARYELQRTSIATTNTLDITLQRGKKGSGMVWQLESQGIIFVRNNAAAAYNVSPNQVLSRRTMRSEIQRLGLNAPANGALITTRCNAVTLANVSIDIHGNNAFGIACVTGTGTPAGAGYTTPTAPTNPQVTGGAGGAVNLGITATPNRFTVPYIFGMTMQELRAMANFEATDVGPAPILPYTLLSGLKTLPAMQLIILNDTTNPTKTYTFDNINPLNGTGILVVVGNLVIAPNSDSNYNGMIFVKGGSFTQGAPSTINGTVIVDAGTTGTVTISGLGDKANLRYDSNLMSYIQRRMGLYNMIRSPYQP